VFRLVAVHFRRSPSAVARGDVPLDKLPVQVADVGQVRRAVALAYFAADRAALGIPVFLSQ